MENGRKMHMMMMIMGKGGRANPMQAVLDASAPRNVKELQSFIGAINYYDNYIYRFASLASPLFKLLQKGQGWIWDTGQEMGFDYLKNRLSEASVLMIYDKSLPLKLDTDASSHGLGVALSQVLPGDSKRPKEARYAQVDKEGASIIFALKKFLLYLLGWHFKVVVDNKVLVRIYHPDKQMSRVKANRLIRWPLTMASTDYEITHRKSEPQNNTDKLSCLLLKKIVPISSENELHHMQVGALPGR